MNDGWRRLWLVLVGIVLFTLGYWVVDLATWLAMLLGLPVPGPVGGARPGWVLPVSAFAILVSVAGLVTVLTRSRRARKRAH